MEEGFLVVLGIPVILLFFYLLSYNTWWSISTYPTHIVLKNNWKIFGSNNYSFEYKEIIIVDLIFYNWTGKILRNKPIIRFSTLGNIFTITGLNVSEVKDLQRKLKEMGVKVISDYQIA